MLKTHEKFLIVTYILYICSIIRQYKSMELEMIKPGVKIMNVNTGTVVEVKEVEKLAGEIKTDKGVLPVDWLDNYVMWDPKWAQIKDEHGGLLAVVKVVRDKLLKDNWSLEVLCAKPNFSVCTSRLV